MIHIFGLEDASDTFAHCLFLFDCFIAFLSFIVLYIEFSIYWIVVLQNICSLFIVYFIHLYDKHNRIPFQMIFTIFSWKVFSFVTYNIHIWKLAAIFMENHSIQGIFSRCLHSIFGCLLTIVINISA